MILQLSQSTGRGLNVGAQRIVKIKQDRLGKVSTRANHESRYSVLEIEQLVCVQCYPSKDHSQPRGFILRGRGTARAVPQSNCHHHHHHHGCLITPGRPLRQAAAVHTGTPATVNQLFPHPHLSTLPPSTFAIPRISLLTPQHSSCNHLDTLQQPQYSVQKTPCQ